MASEVTFWDDYFATEGGELYGQYYHLRFDPDLPLQDFVFECLPRSSTEPHLLDVGAGPLTYLGKQINGQKIKITAIDPLADAYDDILSRHNIQPLVRTQKVQAESICETFRENTFDLAFARNSLDHAHDPVSAIQQMLHVVKPGCSVLLLHRENEASTQHWYGLHQWNFAHNAEGFCISSRLRTVNLDKLLGTRCTIFCGYEPSPIGPPMLKVRLIKRF